MLPLRRSLEPRLRVASGATFYAAPVTTTPEPVARREWLTPARIGAIVVLASIPAKSLSEKLSDPDLWWHLRTGALIVRTHRIPHVDPFSFTVPGKRWILQEWGSEIAMHAIRAGFGLYGILVWRAAMLLLLYLIVARLLVRRMGTGIGTWVLLAIVAYAGQLSWTERPNLFSFVLFAVVLDLLERRSRTIWLFVPIAALWANLHGMVIIGVGLMVVVALTEALKVRLHWDSADPLWARRLGLVAVAGAAATLLNPYGPGLWTHAFSLIGTVSKLITEWASPNFHEVGTIAFLLLLVVTVGGLALSPARPDPTDVAMALAFIVLALSAVRNLTMASIVLGLVAASTVPGAVSAATPRRVERTELSGSSSALLGAVTLAVALAALGLVAAHGFPRSDRPPDIVNKAYPIAAIDALNRPGVRVFALDFWAGLVIDRDWPNAHVYLDTRVDMYGTVMARRYIDAVSAGKDWESDLDRYCTTHVLVRPQEAIAQALALSPRWRVERSDTRSVTFVRRSPALGCESHPIPAT